MVRKLFTLALTSGLLIFPGACRAEAFDCRRAALPMDFVICSSQTVMRANEIHAKAWYAARARLAPAQRHALVENQIEWQNTFPPTCGVPAKGSRPPVISAKEQECIAKGLLARAAFLAAYPDEHSLPASADSRAEKPTTVAEATSDSSATKQKAAGTEAASSSGIDERVAHAHKSAGEAFVKRVCIACHTVRQGAGPSVGPNLWGVVGRRPASSRGYHEYSAALKRLPLEKWTYVALDKWLAGSRRMVPATTEAFAGIRQPKVRADVIAYLATLSSPQTKVSAKDLDKTLAELRAEVEKRKISLPQEITGPFLQEGTAYVRIGEDKKYNAIFWALSYKNNICQSYQPQFWQRRNEMHLHTIVSVEDVSTLWEKESARTLFEKAAKVHWAACGGHGSLGYRGWSFGAYADDAMQALARGRATVLATASGNAGGTVVGVYDYEAQWHKEALRQQAIRAAQERQKAAARQQKLAFERLAAKRRAEFISKVGVKVTAVPFDRLFSNAFAHIGEVVSYEARFVQMRSPDEGVFAFGNQEFVVKEIPRGLLTMPSEVIVAGRVSGTAPMLVMGTSTQTPLLDYIRIYQCTTNTCSEYFGDQNQP